MPFLNMFKPKRSRSQPASERFSDDSELYDQAPMYGSQPMSSDYMAPVHHPQHYASSSRAQHQPHRSILRRKGRERYAQPEAQDQSWYQVEHPNYQHGPQDDYYSEDGDRHSDAYGPAPAVHLISESSRVDSPIPTSPIPAVHRHGGAPGPGSRLYEQFAASAGPPQSAVTRVDLHEDFGADGYQGFNRRQRSTSTHSNPLSYHTSTSHQSLVPALPRHQHRRPPHPAFQGVHLGPTSASSRSDVVQKLENGGRITIPRHSINRGRGSSANANLERTYYIVPPGMNVIFRDEHGNELKRVGDFSSEDGPYDYDEAPVEIADDRGRIMYKTGEGYTDDASDGPKIVHLGQYRSIVPPRSTSPITVSLDRRGYHRHIQLEHSEEGSFGGSLGSDRSLSPHLAPAPSDSTISGPHQPGNFAHRSDQVRLRTIYPQ